MNSPPSIRRVVPNVYSDDMGQSKKFYTHFLAMDLVMDRGWVMTFASNKNLTAQVSIFKNEAKKVLDNKAIFISIEVANVDEMCRRAQEQDVEIVYPITNEPWKVRRFFVKDPNGVTINILSHL